MKSKTKQNGKQKTTKYLEDNTMSKQSSVEWLIEQIEFDANERCFSQPEWFAIFQQAKAMHREEIQNSFVEGTQFICEDELGARFEATMYYVMNYKNEN